MNPIIKKAIAVSGSALLVFLWYYGSYLPMMKSITYINTMQSSQGIKTIKDFEEAFSAPLDYPSPIGQEELVRSTANTVAGSLNNIPSPQGIEEMVRYIQNYYEPIVSRGRGMSFGQNLYILGALHEVAFLKTKNEQHIKDAEKYFKEARDLGPKRPQGLYGLFDVYRIKGDIANAKIVGEQIVSQWPADTKTSDALKVLEAGVSTTTVKAK